MSGANLARSVVFFAGAAIALVFCWFGYDGTRAGIRAGSDLVAFLGFVFFCYGLLSLLLLVRAWVTRSRRMPLVALVTAPVPLALMLVSSFGADGVTRVEVIALLEVGILLVLSVFSVRFVVTRGS